MTGKLLVTAAFLGLAAPALAQTPDKFLLIGGSANAFRGELNQYYNRFKPAVHATLQFNEKKRFNGAINLQVGQLQMQSPMQTIQVPENATASVANSVETSFIGLNYDLHFNFIKTDNWILYISQGIGLLRFEPKDAAGNGLVNNTTTRAPQEEYSQISLMLPTSLGAQYVFKNGYGIGAQAGLMNPTTKYLDNLEDLAGNQQSDNVLQFRFSFIAPLGFKDEAPMME